jgi:hypothetical protein
MYFPYLRGRQFELIALRELIEKSLMGEKVIPIIEPVKMSSTLVKTLTTFTKNQKDIAFIYNPQVGSFNIDAKKEANEKQLTQLKEAVKEPNIIATHYLCKNSSEILGKWFDKGRKASDIMVIVDDEDLLPTYLDFFEDEAPRYCLIKDETELRREIHYNRVLMADKFKKQNRNTDYAKKEDEPFSKDHLYYKTDGYIGFSDYSIIGDDYSDSGFAPYAVAIHIVYFDDKEKLRVKHFVSDTNDDISDPARKFAEAVAKLVEWNKSANINTYAMNQFTEMYKNETYPGLGIVKKLSLMHHIELISSFLDMESEK